jgi:chromate reductase, NAD(P)H dehydrogenase (quinone)
MKILAISGSLRADSLNTKLLYAAAELVDDEVEFEVWDGLKAVPPYDEDDDAGFAPLAVTRLRTAIAQADAVLIATPEYNASIPGQLKNAIDWVSRPVATNPMRNLPVAVIGASTGMFGAVWAQAELKKVVALIGARVLDAELPVSQAPTRFDANGRLIDDEIRERLTEVLNGLVSSAQEREAIQATG